MDNPAIQHSPQPPAFKVSELDLGAFHNDLLPDNVQQEIQKKLADAENQLASLEDVISSVDHPTIGDHRDGIEHSDLAIRIQSYRAALAPHRRLPNDVLLEIFFCCTPNRSTARPHLYSAHAEPNNLRLARVCSKWRQLVLGAPYFWRDIFVHYKTKEDLERNVVLVNDIVLLCGRMSVSLHVRVDDSEDFRFTTAENPISDLLIGVAGRLREFTWVGSDEILVNFLQLPTVSVELLENVCLSVRDELIWERGQLIQVFKNAHKLHTFTMEPMHTDPVAFSPFILHLPWNQMTYLQFRTHIWWEDFLILLYQCPNLTVFRGCIREYSSGSASHIDSQVRKLPTPVPVLPNLKELWIDRDDRLNLVFPHLNLPNLTSLHLYDTNRVFANQWDLNFLPFLLRSNCLTQLTLGRARGYEGSIPNKIVHIFLHELPSLIHFSFFNPWSRLWSQTIHAMASGELVPKLESLTCLVTLSVFGQFMDMLERRCVLGDGGVMRGFTRIRKVEAIVRFTEEGQVEIWNCSERVESLRAQGLHIEFLPEDHPRLTFWSRSPT
jgi:hypothetical protein